MPKGQHFTTPEPPQQQPTNNPPEPAIFPPQAFANWFYFALRQHPNVSISTNDAWWSWLDYATSVNALPGDRSRLKERLADKGIKTTRRHVADHLSQKRHVGITLDQ